MTEIAMTTELGWALFLGGALCGMAIGICLGVTVLFYQLKKLKIMD